MSEKYFNDELSKSAQKFIHSVFNDEIEKGFFREKILRYFDTFLTVGVLSGKFYFKK